MHRTGGLQSEEAETAAWEGGRGALIGASKACCLEHQQMDPRELTGDCSGVWEQLF
jgi:hypothetical protein